MKEVLVGADGPDVVAKMVLKAATAARPKIHTPPDSPAACACCDDLRLPVFWTQGFAKTCVSKHRPPWRRASTLTETQDGRHDETRPAASPPGLRATAASCV